MGARTLLVCLDAVEPWLTRRWIDERRLPALERLASLGEARPVENFPGFGNGVFWPSLTTCSGPAEHGRYYFTQLVPGTYTLRDFDPEQDFDVAPFWADVERAGGHVAAIDMVRSPIAHVRHGIELANWLVHDRDAPPYGTPGHLIPELHARFGPDPLGLGSDHFVRAGGSLEALLRACESRVDTKTQWCGELLRDRDWDLFAVTFQEGHDVGHMCWHLHDPAHPRHDAEARQRLGDPLLRIYRRMDDALAALRQAAGPDATTIVITGPGIEANRTGNGALPHLLARLRADTPSPPTAAAGAAEVEVEVSWLRRAYRAYAPRSLKKLARGARESVQGTDAERARAAMPWFDVPHNDNAGAIRLNLVGREPRGHIRPGGEQQQALDWLCDALAEVRDARGQPIVTEFIRVGDVMTGPHLRALPDLIVVWNRQADFAALHSPRIGHLELQLTEPDRTGDHTSRGEVIVSTPCGLRADGDRPLDPLAVGRLVRRLSLERSTPGQPTALRTSRAA
jgi:predicted AlkP superfamily phosphohydrolase/phosphomutase